MDLAQKVRLIEQAEIFIEEKIPLILVVAGEKPVCQLYAGFYREGAKYTLVEDFFPESSFPYKKIKYDIDHQNVQEIVALLEEIKIPYHIRKVKTFSRPVNLFYCESDYLPIVVSQSRRNIRRYIRANDKKDDKALGKLYGYPKTAVKAYLDPKILTVDVIHTEKTIHRNSPIRFLPYLSEFAIYSMSEDNFEEELQTALRWQLTVRTLSWKTYVESFTPSYFLGGRSAHWSNPGIPKELM